MKIRSLYLIATGMFLFTGTLSATLASEQQPPFSQEVRTEIATDRMNDEEEAALKEQRSKEDPEALSAASSLDDAERISNGLTYFTSHAGAFHSPLFVFNEGALVEIEDGSRWTVAYEDRYKTLNWYTSDTIVIVPNSSWFSFYSYQMVNQNTGAIVQVNLDIGPFHNGIFTHWVVGFDDISGVIYLEDGSVWRVSPFDSTLTRQWLLEDRVIIGVNTGWNSDTHPNILINVRKVNYIRADCLN